MGKKKDKKKASKKQKKAALKEAKQFIKSIFDKTNQGSPSGGVGLLIIPIGKPEEKVSGQFEETVSLTGIESEEKSK